jgi:hypothetical protein
LRAEWGRFWVPPTKKSRLKVFLASRDQATLSMILECLSTEMSLIIAGKPATCECSWLPPLVADNSVRFEIVARRLECKFDIAPHRRTLYENAIVACPVSRVSSSSPVSFD